ncbi:glycosyltransferase [Clostridium sp. 'White wine YQ']|uniref:glycosyltransferase n=1 Tax=Clostridium sp. 'White wine YQ' TaxID=3027474 RepID=UPI00236632ED|nr:glycosyltransferase [Clostridium sp. 'White wine YQ']MDD7796210.1 glycosyltransferase [Clostridium sp. 'White wine YQ']
MKKVFSKILLLLFLIQVISPLNVYGVDKKIENSYSEKGCIAQEVQRKLWEEHVQWTRSYIISALANLDDKEIVLQRLLKNQDDIGNSIKPYYGEKAGNALSELLREHISLAGQVVEAAKNGKKDDLEKYNKLWYENADKISSFMSKANQNWDENSIKDMLYKHLGFLTDQVLARLNKDWNLDAVSYDKGQNHMLMFADIISKGIIKQFPDKF